MPIVLTLSGILLVSVALIDAFWTTLSMQGSAPISGRVARLIWDANLKFPSLIRRWISPAIGTLIVLAVMCTWIVLLYGGWFLLFSADPESVIDATTLVPANSVDRLYYVGFSVFTLGVGDFAANGQLWRMATVACSATGLVLVTLSITYLVPVLSAVMQKRQTAGMIHALGQSPAELVQHAWDGEEFSQLTGMLQDIRQNIEQISQQHLAYPVLHYFHTATRRDEFSLALATLEDALQMIHHGVAPSTRPHPSNYQPMRESIGNLLDILGRDFIEPAETAPPPPSLQPLKEAGIPVEPQDIFEEAVASKECTMRRRQLCGFVNDAGWDWESVLERQMDETKAEYRKRRAA